MTSPAQPSGAPAGWYADPHGLPALRWWDGREWTAHIQPGATATVPGVPAATATGSPFPHDPTGPPVPGAHTAEAPGVLAPSTAELTAPSITAPSGMAQQPFSGYSMQPVDAVSPQLGYTTPATPHGPRPAASPETEAEDSAPRNRAVVVGAVSLLINPLLLCSIYAVVLGVRGLPDARRTSTLAIVLGGAGVLTHIALVFLLTHVL
ncbi:hypothetical protein ACTI_54700 [Actinoplanes sp. OR16]|uniref:DUF2510 domain-containing protein n=1 Tax=Actinoplanes sp. OR16 TaxID=946334 RepID=UPI000F6EAA32|nr:DUF2510 domain-containing protein [Actinoplanes sp. OR16]BBH68785.1 hypothetical protein ACTI_54700 [Actinoplanes sp. OR16]